MDYSPYQPGRKYHQGSHKGADICRLGKDPIFKVSIVGKGIYYEVSGDRTRNPYLKQSFVKNSIFPKISASGK